jgi:hypothetical protein
VERIEEVRLEWGEVGRNRVMRMEESGVVRNGVV